MQKSAAQGLGIGVVKANLDIVKNLDRRGLYHIGLCALVHGVEQ